MSWIKIIPVKQAKGRLKKLYGRLVTSDGQVDNIMQAHSLRPHSMEGHMTLYKNVLHHSANSVNRWFLEALGVYVSCLNHCEYCSAHHFAGMKALITDDDRALTIMCAFEADDPAAAFEGKELAALFYARALTRAPSELSEETIENMRTSGWDDGEILEINQVVAYFAYANRTVLGLGVDMGDEALGLSPSGDGDDDWGHA